MKENTSAGKCLFCKKEYLKSAISRHLNTHLHEKIKDNKPGKSFHIKVETDSYYGSSPYFLSLWINGNTFMEDIDHFLRKIWLECCGHMSAFSYPRRNAGHALTKALNLMAKGDPMAFQKLISGSHGEIAMNKKTKDIFHKGDILKYEYDFGSTTHLQLTVVEEFPVKADESIVLLSRNEPLRIMCDTCHKKPATQLCSVCFESGEEDAFFCDACAKKHAKECPDFEDYAAMAVVNSPRMAVCAYAGGSIDKERDKIHL